MKTQLMIATLLVTVAFSHPLMAQDSDDPFGSSEAAANSDPFAVGNSGKKAKRAKPEKIVVHVPTLDLAFRILAVNQSMGSSEFELGEVSQRLKQLREQPKQNEKQIVKLEKRLNYLSVSHASAKRAFENLPMSTTFDLERWQELKHQLNAERKQYVTSRTEERYELKQYRQAIETLKKDNEELRAEVNRLKAGK